MAELRRPAEHAVQAEAGKPEIVPASHTVQFVAEILPNRLVLQVPAGQAVQFSELDELNQPEGQSVQTDDFSFANLPGEHTSQVVFGVCDLPDPSL